MSGGEISDDVRRFIAEHISSAEQLDILLLLQAEPERWWTAAEVSRAVFTVPASSTMRLEDLVARGFLTSSGGADPSYRFEPRDPRLGDQVAALARAYRADRVGVINLVFEKPADPLQSFSDAFRLRKER